MWIRRKILSNCSNIRILQTTTFYFFAISNFPLKTVATYNIDVSPRPEPVLVDDVSDLDNLTLPEGQLIRQLGLETLLGLGNGRGAEVFGVLDSPVPTSPLAGQDSQRPTCQPYRRQGQAASTDGSGTCPRFRARDLSKSSPAGSLGTSRAVPGSPRCPKTREQGPLEKKNYILTGFPLGRGTPQRAKLRFWQRTRRK